MKLRHKYISLLISFFIGFSAHSTTGGEPVGPTMDLFGSGDALCANCLTGTSSITNRAKEPVLIPDPPSSPDAQGEALAISCLSRVVAAGADQTKIREACNPNADCSKTPACEKVKGTPTSLPARTAATPGSSKGNSPIPVGSGGNQSSPAGSNSVVNFNNNSDSNSDSDRHYCQSLQQAATKCCMDPTQCGAGSPVPVENPSVNGENSFPELCKQMNSAGAADARSNLNAGTLCLQKYSTCQVQCDSLANNYSGSIAEGFRSAARACTSLSSRAAALGRQATASNTAANAGQNCDGLTQSMAQGLNALGGAGAHEAKAAALNHQQTDVPQAFKGNSNDPYGCASNPGSSACQRCANNPSLAACKALASGSAIAEGKAGYYQPTNDQGKQNQFNVGSTNDAASGTPEFGKFEPKANTVHTVANNSGGGIPGSDNGGKGASLGVGAGKGGAGATAGYTTDIDQGTRSGGGYSNPVGGAESADNLEPAGFNGYGGRGREPASAKSIDLKKYLPGGERDPGHSVGGLRGRSGEINGPSVDIWTKISARFQEKCRLGELFDCR